MPDPWHPLSSIIISKAFRKNCLKSFPEAQGQDHGRKKMEMRCKLLANGIRPGPSEEVLHVEWRVNTRSKFMTWCWRATFCCLEEAKFCPPPASMMAAPSQPRGGLGLSGHCCSHWNTTLNPFHQILSGLPLASPTPLSILILTLNSEPCCVTFVFKGKDNHQCRDFPLTLTVHIPYSTLTQLSPHHNLKS